jgi:hypothetical protein
VPALERAGSGCTGLASAWLVSTTTTPGAGEGAAAAAGTPRAPLARPERTAPACAASAWLGIEASQAWASRDRVRWRYQLGQCRTSSWSSPVSPFRDGAQEAGLVQDADPLRVTEGLAPEGPPTVPGGIHLPVDPGEQPLPAARGGLPHRLRHLPAVLALHRASRPRRCSAACWRDSRRANRSAKRAGKARQASPQRPRSSCVVTPSVEGTPILPGWSALGKVGLQ